MPLLAKGATQPVRVKKFDPLFDSEEIRKLKEKVINDRIKSIYDNKAKSLGKDYDKMDISEGFMLDSEFVTSQVLETMPTGDVRFDMRCAVDKFGHRGIPRGKVMEISGPNECMKSARAYDMIADFQADSRGSIVTIYETESKANARYVAAAGCKVDEIIITLPDYIEQVYHDMERSLRAYTKSRNAASAAYIKKNCKKKSMTNFEFDKLMFRARMSYPLWVALYDSVGNAQSMEQWQKTQKGTTTKTPGKHAQAHADGMRSIRNALGNSMGILILINHTKAEMGGMTAAWGEKKTTTYGGDHLKYMSDIRIEQKGGVGLGGPQTTMLRVTRKGEDITIGKWLNVKFLKNSLLETSQQKLEHTLFRYRSGAGFDMGVSYMLAMQKLGMVKGDLKLLPSNENTLILPDKKEINITFVDFHDMLVKKPDLKNKLRELIEEDANNNSTLMRKDI